MDVYSVCIILFLILTIVLIVVTINACLMSYFDSHLVYKLPELIEKPEYNDLVIQGVGMAYTTTRCTQLKSSNLFTHIDLVFKTDVGLITLANLWSTRNKEELKTKDINNIITPVLITPNIDLVYYIDGFKYKIVNYVELTHKSQVTCNLIGKSGSENLTDSYNTIGEVYLLLCELYTIPYHKIHNNCHHLNYIIFNILTQCNKHTYDFKSHPLKLLSMCHIFALDMLRIKCCDDKFGLDELRSYIINSTNKLGSMKPIIKN